MIGPRCELDEVLGQYQQITGQQMQFRWNAEKKVWYLYQFNDADRTLSPWEDDERPATNLRDAEVLATKYMIEIVLPWATALHSLSDVEVS
jgi:hypothetical protein